MVNENSISDIAQLILEYFDDSIGSSQDIDLTSDNIYKFKDFHLLSIDANGDGVVSSQERKVYLNNGDTSFEQLSVLHLELLDLESEKIISKQKEIRDNFPYHFTK